MHRRNFLQLSTLGVLPASLGLSHTAFAQAKGPIQFGCPVPMSGAFAANGKFADLGMKLAIEQYGKALDRPLAYTLLDTEGKPAQDVKKVVAELKAQKRSMASTHRKVHRPWGWYDSIDSGERFQVKRIVVNPGAKLSLQMHHHRAEHWIVVSGTAEVTNGDKTFLLTENESTYIPVGHTHRLANPGKVPLELIEVQSGSYLGEDDIVRFEDTYGR